MRLVPWVAVLLVASGCSTQRCRARPYDVAGCAAAIWKLDDAEHERVVAELLQRDREFCATPSREQWLALGGREETSLEEARVRSCVYAALEIVRARVEVPGRRARWPKPLLAAPPAAQGSALSAIPLEVPAGPTGPGRSDLEARCVGLVVRLFAGRLGLVEEPAREAVDRAARAACAGWSHAAANQRPAHLGLPAAQLQALLDDIDTAVADVRAGRRQLFDSPLLEAGRARALAEEAAAQRQAREEARRALRERARAREPLAAHEALAALDQDLLAQPGVEAATVVELGTRCLERADGSDPAVARLLLTLPLASSTLAKARSAWRAEWAERLHADARRLSRKYPFVGVRRLEALAVFREFELAEALARERAHGPAGRSKSLARELALIRAQAADAPLYLLTPAIAMRGLGACSTAPLEPADASIVPGEASLTGTVVVASPQELRMVDRQVRRADTRSVDVVEAPIHEPWQQCIRDSMGQCRQRTSVRAEAVTERGGTQRTAVQTTVTRSEVTLQGRLTLRVAEQVYEGEVQATVRRDNLPYACRDAAREVIQQVLAPHAAEIKQWTAARVHERVAKARDDLERLEAQLELEALTRSP